MTSMLRALMAMSLVAAAVQDKPALPPEPDANAQKETLKSLYRRLFGL